MWTLTPGLRRWADAIWHRWPAWLAIALTVPTAAGGSPGADSLAGLSDALLIFGLNYVVLSLLQWRRATWPVVVTLIAGLIRLRLLDRIDPTLVLWGAVRGRLQRKGRGGRKTPSMSGPVGATT